MDLFSKEANRIELPDGWIYFDPHFMAPNEAEHYFTLLKESLPWQQNEIKLFGKTHPTPRLESYHAENGEQYAYSGKILTVNSFTTELLQIKEGIERLSGLYFNAVLANFYRSEKDSNGWHSDDEPELGLNPQIASLSLGATRRFDLKHKQLNQKLSLELTSGSLLIMGGSMQHHWKHQIPKTAKLSGPRINLTFRKVY